MKMFDEYAISFYDWMQDNYVQVGDGYIRDMNINTTKRVITTIEMAMDLYKKENK
jgi:hypothetical protein